MIDRETYAAHIPDCCKLRTVEEHEEIMLCWGLTRQIEQGTDRKDQNCGLCEFNNLFTTEEYKKMWREALEKMNNEN